MRGARITAAAVAAVGLLAAIGATVATGKPNAGNPIIIGAAIDASGQMSPFDDPALTAAQLEIKKINAAGGVNGRQLEMMTCDTKNSTPGVATSCASSLASKGAVIGWVTCDVNFAAPAALTCAPASPAGRLPCPPTQASTPTATSASPRSRSTPTATSS